MAIKTFLKGAKEVSNFYKEEATKDLPYKGNTF